MEKKRQHKSVDSPADVAHKKRKIFLSDDNPTELHTAPSTPDHVQKPVQVLHEVSKGSVESKDGLPSPSRMEGPLLSKALNFPVLDSYMGTPQPSKASQNPKAYNGHPSTLPALPPILDESLSQAVFTHQSRIHGHKSTKLHLSYDRLEFLGDAYIELIATRLIFPLYPHLPAGRLSQQRELLVKNETLAEYALAYHFDETARLPSSFKTQGQKEKTKVLGDIFEAYVAALIISNPDTGYQTAETWLNALWTPKLSAQSSRETRISDPNAKADLGRKVMGKGIKLEYRSEAPPQVVRKEGKEWYQIGVFLTGWGWENARLGGGCGLSKQEAGNVAAMDALDGLLTVEVEKVKREFDRKVREEREAAELVKPSGQDMGG